MFSEPLGKSDRRMRMKHSVVAATVAALTAAFALLLAACGGSTAPHAGTPPVAMVSGKVTAGPTCPVERAGHPCPPKPLVATIRATAGTRLAASTASAGDGTYRFELPSGAYIISAATAGAFPRCNPKTITVVAPAAVEVDIACDTGIR